MSLDASKRPGRRGSNPDLWPKWMWIVVPVLAVVVVAALWWAVFSEPEVTEPTPTPTPTMRSISTQPAEQVTPEETVAGGVTPTRPSLPPLSTATATPGGEPAAVGPAASTGGSRQWAPDDRVRVEGTGGAGLNMRAGAGTDHPRIKTVPEGGVLEIIGGPREANGFAWWQVRDSAGTLGWVVDEFLTQAN